jgi:hypothetical protein
MRAQVASALVPQVPRQVKLILNVPYIRLLMSKTCASKLDSCKCCDRFTIVKRSALRANLRLHRMPWHTHRHRALVQGRRACPSWHRALWCALMHTSACSYTFHSKRMVSISTDAAELFFCITCRWA